MKTYARQEIIGERRDALQMLAHDLRTPMCCVAGAAQMAMLAAKQGEAVDRQLQQILQAVSAMDSVLSSACGAAAQSVRTGGMEESLRAVIVPMAERKRQKITLDIGVSAELMMGSGSDKLMRVLLNLLDNAVKYTPEGGEISLLGRMKPGLRPGQARRMVFIVQDSGVGMKPEFLARLYEAHARAEETAHLPGKGLGLSIVQSLVREMGGTIGVASEWGKGTTFTVSIPAQNARLCG